jgi:5-methylcytosine-specific restriction enzyme subunit McrC
MDDRVVELADLSRYCPNDSDEAEWLERLADKISPSDHVLNMGRGFRRDEEDPPALSREGDGSWWAGRFVGELRFEERTLRITPRLGMDVLGQWLAIALNVSFVPQSASLGSSAPLMAQLLDRVWAGALATASRHGGPRLRRGTRSEGLFLRGTLDVPGTVRLRGSGQRSVASRRVQRDLENPVARALVLADRTLRSLLMTEPSWRPDRTEELLAHLRGAVGGRPELPSHRDLASVRYSPITKGYRPVAELSLEIAQRAGRITSASDSRVSGFLVDVAELWELYLLHCTRRAFPEGRVEHGTQEADRHLLRSMSQSGVTMGRIKPDIIVSDRAGRPRLVVDAKYKRLNSTQRPPHGVDRGDLYQLSAYMTGEPLASDGMLLYPAFEGDEALAETCGPWRLRRDQALYFRRVSPLEDEAIRELSRLGLSALRPAAPAAN